VPAPSPLLSTTDGELEELSHDRPLALRVARQAEEGDQDLVRSFSALETLAPSLAEAGVGERLAARLRLRAGEPLSPWLHLHYWRIGHHLRRGGDPAHMPVSIENLLGEIERSFPAGTVLAFADNAVIAGPHWESLVTLFAEGGDFPTALVPPDPAAYSRLAAALADARLFVHRCAPELGGLLDRLQHLIVLAAAAPGAGSFGGATTFFFRGGVLIDHRRPHTLPSLLASVVHEYAHAELFVLAQGERLCTNPDHERHAIRVRPDPRPMNGILHSLHVMGRVVGVFDRLLAGGLPWRSDRSLLLEEVERLRREHVSNGLSSLAVALQHGRLTPLGQAVAEAAARRLGAPVAARWIPA
jgi:HEXXH motif-containing protein